MDDTQEEGMHPDSSVQMANNSVSSMEEGQEEWLSEGVLTDEDYNITGDAMNASNHSSNQETALDSTANASVTHHYELQLSANEPPKLIRTIDSVVENVEETLQRLEGKVEENERDTEKLLEELGTFLIRKPDAEQKNTEQMEGDEERGRNSTEDLLQMLGDSDKKADVEKQDGGENKMASLSAANDSTDDDIDNIIQQAAKVTKLKFAKNTAATRREPTKAEPEKMSDYDEFESTDEDDPPPQRDERKTIPVKHIKTTQKPNERNTRSLIKPNAIKPEGNIRRNVGKVVTQQSTPNVTGKRIQPPVKTYPGGIVRKQERERTIGKRESDSNDKIQDEEEETSQRIMKPEQMDEDVPTDSESAASDESYYDDMPSSESEGFEEWFELDIRGESAGDYIPLLGKNAYDLLSAEKARVTKKLTALKYDLEAINASSKKNIKEIEDARRKITELDGLIAQA